MLKIKYQRNCFEENFFEVFVYDESRTFESLKPSWTVPYICLLNGEPLSREDWHFEVLEEDEVIFKTCPLELTSALIFGAIAQYSLYIVVGVSIAAGLLLSRRVNLNNPNVDVKSPSPTYNIAITGNQVRLNEPAPVFYGRHLIVPDFACKSYIEYDINSNQIFNAIFSLGPSEKFDIEKIYIDDTDINNFSNFRIEYQGPNFPSQNIGSVYRDVVTAPEVSQNELIFNEFNGAFSACGPGLTTNRIACDIILPNGLYGTNTNGSIGDVSVIFRFDGRKIDDLGNAMGSWFRLSISDIEIGGTFTNVIRQTYIFIVAQGRYEIRAIRLNQKITDLGVANDIQWTGLKSYISNSPALLPTVNFMSVRIQSSSLLSNNSERKFSLIVNRYLPTWSPSGGWTAPQKTRSPAWAAADILRNQKYGSSLSDSKIDLHSLYEIAQICESRKDFFDGIFDKKITTWQAVESVMNVCRSKPIIKSNLISFIRDQKQQIPVCLFSKRNILKESFTIDYLMPDEDAPQAFELEYFSSQSWSSKWVTINAHNFLGTPVRVQRISIIQGITEEKQAQRECAFIAAGLLRGSLISFVTELEGFICSYGDLISVSHDLCGWGQDGDVLEYDELNRIVTVSENIVFSSSDNFASFSSLQGDLKGPYRILPFSENSFKIVDELDLLPGGGFLINTDYNFERTKFQISNSTNYARKCRIIELTPQSETTILVKAVVENEAIHDADRPYRV
jgi:hypothetical protein